MFFIIMYENETEKPYAEQMKNGIDKQYSEGIAKHVGQALDLKTVIISKSMIPSGMMTSAALALGKQKKVR